MTKCPKCQVVDGIFFGVNGGGRAKYQCPKCYTRFEVDFDVWLSLQNKN